MLISENWKRQVHAVFAINLVAPKGIQLRRSIENVKVMQFILIKKISSCNHAIIKA